MGFALVLTWLVVACILIETGRAMDKPAAMLVGAVMVMLTACLVQFN